MKIFEQALTYAKNVVEGKEITTKEVKTQCQWFLDDYFTNQYKDDFQYYFDDKQVQKINNLLRLLNYATGFVAGKPVLDHIADYQAFLITMLFGWRFKDKPYKFRYNDITLYIARKNAKTATVGIIFILLMLTEQAYSEFYSVCLNRELAAEIRKSMVQILDASPAIRPYFKISQSFTGKLECTITKSFFQARVAESGKNNSIRPSAFVSDEHGNMKDPSNFNAMKSGQRNVLNPLTFRTTTAYAIDNSIMMSDLDYIKKVFNGTVENQRMLALLYYADEEHLWDDIGLYQANPLRIEENYETIREERAKAQVQDNVREEYLTKSMNFFMPENSGEEFINIQDVKKCKAPAPFNWKGKRVMVGVDLSQTNDNTAVTMVHYDKLNQTFYVKAMGFIPADSVSDKSSKEHVDYNKYIRKNWCIPCGDRVIDYDVVEKYVMSLESVLGVKIDSIGYDRYNCISSAQKWKDAGYRTVEIRQHSSLLHPAIKLIKESILTQHFCYDANEMLEINFENCKQVEDTNLNKYISKKKSTGKIDLVAALWNAMYLWYVEILKNGSVYERRGVRVL